LPGVSEIYGVRVHLGHRRSRRRIQAAARRTKILYHPGRQRRRNQPRLLRELRLPGRGPPETNAGSDRDTRGEPRRSLVAQAGCRRLCIERAALGLYEPRFAQISAGAELNECQRRKEREMSRVRVLVGTRKGAFILESDGKRQNWEVSGPHFAGWEIYHMKGSP